MTSSRLENTVDIGKRHDVGLDSALGRNVLLVWVDLQYNTGDGFYTDLSPDWHRPPQYIQQRIIFGYSQRHAGLFPSSIQDPPFLFTSGIEPAHPRSTFNPSYIPADSAYALYRVTQLLSILAVRLLRVPRRR